MVTVVWNLVAANQTHRRNICFKSNQCPFGFQMTYECHPLSIKCTDQRLCWHSNGRWHSITLVWLRLYIYILTFSPNWPDRNTLTFAICMAKPKQTSSENMSMPGEPRWYSQIDWMEGWNATIQQCPRDPGYLLHIIYIYYVRGDEILPKGIFISQYKDSVVTLMCVWRLVKLRNSIELLLMVQKSG